MSACGAVCTCHADCPMVCSFRRRHEGACDWWLAADGDRDKARAHSERKAGQP